MVALSRLRFDAECLTEIRSPVGDRWGAFETRVLTKDEIRILGHGLYREDLPYDRSIRYAIKFALVICGCRAATPRSVSTTSRARMRTATTGRWLPMRSIASPLRQGSRGSAPCSMHGLPSCGGLSARLKKPNSALWRNLDILSKLKIQLAAIWRRDRVVKGAIPAASRNLTPSWHLA